MPAFLRRLREWPSVRHSLAAETATVIVLYGMYEFARGFVVGHAAEADGHARRIAALERSLHVAAEAGVQRFVHALPGLTGLFDAAYLTLHLTVTIAVLLWLHRHRPGAFPFVRNALLLASALALVGFLVYPTAPPRLAATGITDTISRGGVDLNRGLVSSLYNPYAAVPSMHIAYALVVAGALFRTGRRRVVRMFAVLYPPFVLLVIVATGNHFFFDAAAGAVVAGLAAAAAAVLTRRRPTAAIRIAPAREQPPDWEELAA